MALKALMLRKKLSDAQKALNALTAKDAEFTSRESEIATSIEEAETEEEKAAVEEAVTAFETDKAAHESEKEGLEGTIRDLEEQLSAEERAQNTEPAPDAPAPEIPAQEVRTAMRKNIIFDRMTAQERTALIQREDVKAWLTEVRACMTEKRAITNVGLTIPEVMLGLLRENIIVYSKLYKHVTVRPVGGTARQLIMGTVPEAIWTDCCANLNELTLGFNDLEMDCFKVGGFFAICNANLEDSDIDLAAELLSALGQAIGLALDKAILYGRNASGTQKMPMGIVSRLVQTEAPTGYPATARTWADLHTSNVQSITAANSTGIKLFQSLVSASGAIKGKYSRGEKTWVGSQKRCWRAFAGVENGRTWPPPAWFDSMQMQVVENGLTNVVLSQLHP